MSLEVLLNKRENIITSSLISAPVMAFHRISAAAQVNQNQPGQEKKQVQSRNKLKMQKAFVNLLTFKIYAVLSVQSGNK